MEGQEHLYPFTVKIATHTVARMKLLDDLYSSNHGFFGIALPVLSRSPAMIQVHNKAKEKKVIRLV